VSRLTFRLRAPPPQRVDLSALTPQALNGRSAAEIAAWPIHTTRAALNVGDLFDIKEGDLDEIVFEGGAERLDRVGAHLGAGAIRVIGDVGVEAGRGMTGGALTIEGGAGPYAGSGLRGGLLKIHGDAGERLEGEAGDYAGSRMIAGTLAIGGRAGALPGYLMNRGTILLSGGVAEMAPTFLDCGVFELVAARLLATHVETMSPHLGAAFRGPLRRYAGDLAALGKGEIFVRAP
jgi:formylmethanofuran dehydrogenase subunit C